jgi:hypothetical protein
LTSNFSKGVSCGALGSFFAAAFAEAVLGAPGLNLPKNDDIAEARRRAQPTAAHVALVANGSDDYEGQLDYDAPSSLIMFP